MTHKMDRKALVILSGGQDSTTCLYIAREEYGRDNVHALTFDYGQTHRIEIDAARTIGIMAGVSNHEVAEVQGIMLSTSPLLSDAPLEQYSDYKGMVEHVGDKTENTFVPMRNALFLTIAANRAYAHRCQAIYIGVSQEDTANYPDTTQPFIRAAEHTTCTALGSPGIIRIEAPLMHMTKGESIKLARTLPGCWEALAHSHTSYAGEYPPVDKNHANVLRAKGFEESGFPDPLVLRAWADGLMALPDTPNYDFYRSPLHP